MIERIKTMNSNRYKTKFRKTKLSERAEAMPAAIVTAIISSMLLLGIAGIVSIVVQSKSDSQASVSLATVASNIDVSLRTDVTQAKYISAAAKLKQPASRLLTPTDVLLSGANMHAPQANGECKVIRWSINGTTASRDLTVYKSSLKDGSFVKCDETSPVLAKRTKVFAQNVNVKTPFKFHNQVGREIVFTIENKALNEVNAKLDAQLKAKGVQKLNDADFNELNKMMGTDSYTPGFVDACVMNAAKVNGKCPEAEADTVAAAWNSLKIAKVSVNFEILNQTGEVVKRDVEQNSSVPLYADAAEAEAAVADSSAENRPIAPVVALSTANVVLGTDYTINWTAGGACPVNMVKTYKVYENNLLINTSVGLNFTKKYTNSATQFLNYVIQIDCTRGALIVNSDTSNVATAKVIPAVPALVINTQPVATNAVLNSALVSTATCLYGTSPRYNIIQTVTTWGAAGTTVSNVTMVNRSINNGFTVVEGARYQYKVEAWCISAYDKSALTNASTSPFTTLITRPSTPTFTTPAANAVNVATNATVAWNAVACATGTAVKYYSYKDTNAGGAITPSVIYNWTSNLNFVSNNTEGNTVGYGIQARCEGSAVGVNSAASASSNRKYTTVINVPAIGSPVFISPAKGAANIATNATVTWRAATCAPATTTQYYTTKNIDKNVSITPQVLKNWTIGTTIATNNTEGNTVGYTVAARCAGPNANSVSSATDTLKYTTIITAPAGPVFTAPADGATKIATNVTVTWSAVTCATGTTLQYFTTKNINAGVGIVAQVINNWTAGTSFVSNNTEGNTVGYTVAARCVGPNSTSAVSATDTVKYTTIINAPNNVAFIAPTPAAGATKVPTNATLAWSSVTCATGTTAKYYSYKDMADGVVISRIVIDDWTTDRSYVTTNAASQGSTVRYAVAARCEGPNVSSASTPTVTRQYTTDVDAPGGSWAWHNNYSTVLWNPPSAGCAGGATIRYRVHQTKADNNAVNAYGAWTTGSSDVLPTYNTGGYPQWAVVETKCVGPNAESIIDSGNMVKWVKHFDVAFSAGQQWRRINVWASCPYATSVKDFHLYVAANGWWGARGVYGGIYTDEGAWIADAQAGGGGNSGWIAMNQTVNQKWNAAARSGTTHHWGYWGNAGWGSDYSTGVWGANMSGTYWNASGWGNWAYWWAGSCSSPYMTVYAKNGVWTGGQIRNAGNPGAYHNNYPSGAYLTTAGVNAIR
jgi:hypothetical protein